MKKKRKLRVKRIVLSIFILVLVFGGLAVLVHIFNSKSDDIVKELVVEINSEEDLLKRVDGSSKLVSGKSEVDTSRLGKQEIELVVETNEKQVKYLFKINVVDTTAPEISYKRDLSTKVGTTIDLTKDVVVKDNSLEDIKVSIEGDYDFNKEGKYNLTYVASDSSGNRAKEDFTLEVKKENTTVVTGNYPALEVPDGEKELVGTTSKGYDIYKINGSIYIEGILIANKTYALRDNYVPANTFTSSEGITSLCNTCIEKTAYQAWLDLKNTAASLGLNLWLQSGYRPQSMQVKLYNGYVARDGVEAADTYSSRPGHSEHQTGLSFDLNTITDSFAYTNEGKWVNDNCYKFGYIIRFPKGKENETGYQYEPWHIRYVGKDLATKLYNNGNWLSLEDYFGITSQYE